MHEQETETNAPPHQYVHVPHPWIQQRAAEADAKLQKTSAFNDHLAAKITTIVGSMWAVYAVILVTATWIILGNRGVIHDPYPFALLLFISNFVQLAMMFVLLVGQRVLSASGEDRANATYKDAEATLHECLSLQQHMAAQDKALETLIAEMTALKEKE